MTSALIVIDAQNDYLRTGKYPLWNTETVVSALSAKIVEYTQRQAPVIFVRHLAAKGAPFFEEGTSGANIITELLALVDNPIIIDKRHGNAFDETKLDYFLTQHECDQIELCGMMTQNCVLFTALSEQARAYHVRVYEKGCTSVSAIIHAVAIKGLARVPHIDVL